METKIEKELMPLEMVRALMIEKGVDKALNLWIAWEKVAKDYSVDYFIPCGKSIKKYYEKTITEIFKINVPSPVRKYRKSLLSEKRTSFH